jgi:hypothetical protein
MTATPIDKGLVLAVHPTTRGFGWILFEGPLAPVDWGIAFGRKGNERLVKRYQRLLSRYEPSVLVLEEFDSGNTRAERLNRLMVHMAKCQNMEVQPFKRSAVQAVFGTVGARTRYEIAEVIRQQIAAFSHRMPRKRSLLVPKDPKQALFDAAAVATTYFAVTGDKHGN